MTTGSTEQVSFSGALFESTRGSSTFIYESPQRWEKLPFQRFNNISNATYPPLKRIATILDRPHDFPEYDFLIEEEDKPPILFTGAHNRLLYEITNGSTPMLPNSKRHLINLDQHNDIMMGTATYREDDIHIGNWVAGGAVGGYWGSYTHLDESYEPALSLNQKLEVIPFGLTDQTLPVNRVSTKYDFVQLQNVIKGLLDKIGDNPFIFTLDADSVVDWKKKYSVHSSQMLEIILKEVLSRKNLELFHFTPSPAYCPAEEAVKVWDKFRNVWRGIK